MTTSTLSLLGMPSTQALRVLVQDALKPGVAVNDLVISRPVVETGDEMSARIAVAGSAYERADFPYFGATTFTYHRLDLDDTFSPLGLRFNVTYPIVTSHIVNFMTEALGIEFDEDDYVEELIEAPADTDITYVLKAAPNSPRWMGQVTIQLHGAG